MRRALVVDDSPATRHALKSILATMSIEADEVGNGQEAIDFCRRSPAPDIILLDMEMPVMNGLQFVKVLRADHRWDGIRVVICSETANLAAVQMAMSLGADEYIPKPFSASSIREKVGTPRAYSRPSARPSSTPRGGSDGPQSDLAWWAAVASRLVDDATSLPTLQHELRTLSAGLHRLAETSRMSASKTQSGRIVGGPSPESVTGPVSPSAARVSSSLESTTDARVTRGTVLVVDDSEAVLAMVRNCLRPKGIRVITTTSPVCSPLITMEKPDVVLLDIEMPGLGGDQMSEAISRTLERISGGTLLFYSSLPAEKLDATVARYRVQGAISKSLPARQFIEQIEEWLSVTKGRIANSRPGGGGST